MQRLLPILFALALALAPAFAQASEAVEENCYVQGTDIQAVRDRLQDAPLGAFHVGSVSGSLVGNLGALGNGGLLAVLSKSEGLLLFLESGESTPLVSKIRQNADRGLTMIAYLKKCLTDLDASSAEARAMNELAENSLEIKGAAGFFRL